MDTGNQTEKHMFIASGLGHRLGASVNPGGDSPSRQHSSIENPSTLPTSGNKCAWTYSKKFRAADVESCVEFLFQFPL